MHDSGASGPDDTELIARARAGDREAFAALYTRYQAAIYRFAVHMSGSATTGEDVVQDVFVALVRNLGAYDADRPLSGYLYGIARNITRRRLARERRLIPLEGSGEHEARHDVAMDLERRDHLRVLRHAILTLSTKHREVIVMCDLHRMSYELAADAIGCPVGTVRSRLNRARALLARHVQHAQAPVRRVSREGFAV